MRMTNEPDTEPDDFCEFGEVRVVSKRQTSERRLFAVQVAIHKILAVDMKTRLTGNSELSRSGQAELSDHGRALSIVLRMLLCSKRRRGCCQILLCDRRLASKLAKYGWAPNRNVGAMCMLGICAERGGREISQVQAMEAVHMTRPRVEIWA
jgi:hypothetical protein